MKSIVANVLEEFEVDVVKDVAGGGVPEHVLSVTLRMKGGLLSDGLTEGVVICKSATVTYTE
jgi:hypothetical protein